MNTQEEISNNKLIENLNDIVVKNYDASKGYRRAAENLEHSSYGELFRKNAHQRMEFAGKLQEEIRVLGGEPNKDGSIMGNAHRAWMDFKEALASNKTEAVLEECCTGEKVAMKEYDELLEKEIPKPIQDLVVEQRNHVNQSYQHLKSVTA